MDIIKKIITEFKKAKKLTLVELLKLTLYTVIFCAIIALIILGADIVFQFGLAEFLKL